MPAERRFSRTPSSPASASSMPIGPSAWRRSSRKSQPGTSKSSATHADHRSVRSTQPPGGSSSDVSRSQITQLDMGVGCPFVKRMLTVDDLARDERFQRIRIEELIFDPRRANMGKRENAFKPTEPDSPDAVRQLMHGVFVA